MFAIASEVITLIFLKFVLNQIILFSGILYLLVHEFRRTGVGRNLMDQNDILNELVEEVRGNFISVASRNQYNNKTILFLLWLLEFEPTLIRQELGEYFFNQFSTLETENQDSTIEQLLKEQKKQMVLFLKEYLNNAPNNPPIYFERIDSRLFLKYVLTLRKSDGSNPGNSTYKAHRTAFYYLFRIYDATMSPSLKEQMTRSFKGLTNAVAQRISNGEGNIKQGKDPMDFSFVDLLH